MPRSVLLFAHSDPPISGQAAIVASLVEVSEGWQDVRLVHHNAALSHRREDFGGLSVGKLFTLAKHLVVAGWTVLRDSADTVILTPAFFRGAFLKDAVVAFWFRHILRRRLIGWVHMDPNRLDWDTLPGWLRRIVGFTLSGFDTWVACSPALTATWPETLRSRHLVGIANAVPDATKPATPGTRPTLRVLFLSAMDPEKGWPELLDAARSICADMPDVEFVFHGGPGGKTSREDIDAAFDTPFGDRIRWEGPAYADAKAEAYAAADLFCFPSHTEQFPLSVLEAMAAGLPVIATRVGGVPDQLGDDSALIPARDREALEAALRSALADRAALADRGRANRERFAERFSLPAFSRAWETMLASR